MRLELDEYSEPEDRIKCTAKTDDGEYSFYWETEIGVTPVAGLDNQQTNLTLKERLEAADRAEIAYHMIYGLDHKL